MEFGSLHGIRRKIAVFLAVSGFLSILSLSTMLAVGNSINTSSLMNPAETMAGISSDMKAGGWGRLWDRISGNYVPPARVVISPKVAPLPESPLIDAAGIERTGDNAGFGFDPYLLGANLIRAGATADDARNLMQATIFLGSLTVTGTGAGEKIHSESMAAFQDTLNKAYPDILNNLRKYAEDGTLISGVTRKHRDLFRLAAFSSPEDPDGTSFAKDLSMDKDRTVWKRENALVGTGVCVMPTESETTASAALYAATRAVALTGVASLSLPPSVRECPLAAKAYADRFSDGEMGMRTLLNVDYPVIGLGGGVIFRLYSPNQSLTSTGRKSEKSAYWGSERPITVSAAFNTIPHEFLHALEARASGVGLAGVNSTLIGEGRSVNVEGRWLSGTPAGITSFPATTQSMLEVLTQWDKANAAHLKSSKMTADEAETSHYTDSASEKVVRALDTGLALAERNSGKQTLLAFNNIRTGEYMRLRQAQGESGQPVAKWRIDEINETSSTASKKWMAPRLKEAENVKLDIIAKNIARSLLNGMFRPETVPHVKMPSHGNWRGGAEDDGQTYARKQAQRLNRALNTQVSLDADRQNAIRAIRQSPHPDSKMPSF